MGKHRSLDERLAHAERMAERNRKAMEHHAKRAQHQSRTGQYEAATKSCQLHERAKRLRGKWLREARKLSGRVGLRDAMARRRLPDIGPSPLTAAGEGKLTRARMEEKRKRLAAAGIDHWDHRTAAGKRTYDVVSLGARSRASVNHFHAVVRKKADRTDARALAWAHFEAHYHKVAQGLIANPRYEPGVDVSTVPGVPDSRLDALRKDHALREEVGRFLHGLLVEVVYQGKHLRELSALAAFGSEKDLLAVFLRALDLTALFFRIGEDRGGGRRRTHAHRAPA